MYFKSVYWLEVLILGLRVKVEGQEHLPEDGKFIVAAKHQSAHETMIFPLLLNDPAIIMKKGLMQIPLWGWYAKKAGMIGVDRGGRQKAIASIVEGSKKVFADNRPLIIFPQGTRTDVGDTTRTRPYKGGIAKIYEQVSCPIVPAAINSGVFWGRNSFIKKSGTITIKFLPAIPANLPPSEMMEKLEQTLEPESARLVEEAQAKLADEEFKRGVSDIFGIITILIMLWSGYWLYMAKSVEHLMLDARTDLQDGPVKISYEGVGTSGYPAKIGLTIKDIRMDAPNIQVSMPELLAQAFPIPGYPLTIESKQPILIKPLLSGQKEEFVIDYLGMEVANAMPSLFQNESAQQSYYLKSLLLKSGKLTMRAFGTIAQDTETLAHNGELVVVLEGYNDYLNDMIDKGVAERTPTLFFLGMLQNQSEQWLEKARQQKRDDIPNLSKDALILPFTIQDNDVYAGMFKIGSLGKTLPRKSQNALDDIDQELNPLIPPAPSGKDINIDEFMQEEDLEATDMDTLLGESIDLPPSPDIIRNE
jgi:1-acyl-sn-glycerol-3-phosphate acyltransferase